MDKVSVIIPGRCEQYFQQTIDSVLESATGDIEVIAVVDGYEPSPALIARDELVKIIYLKEPIGQRAGYNLGVKNSAGKYVMKIDAHALLSKGFDEELKSHCPDNAVVLPEMRRLDVRKWQDKPRGRTHFMYFGTDLYCHYWQDYKKREQAKADYPEVLTGQGSCWFTTREWNNYIGLLDEKVGSWGNVGIEVSLRTWLCGGSQILNRRVWQAHWFRRTDGGFTYPMSGRQVAKAHSYTHDNYYYKDDAFGHQCRPFRWLIEKFEPVPGWEAYLADNGKPKAVLYYTNEKSDPKLLRQVRKNLSSAVATIPIYSVTQQPLNYGTNICVGDKPVNYRSMFEQVIEGLKIIPPKTYVYLCEHDVFYHPSHFAFLPPDDKPYFNTNRYYWCGGLNYYFKAIGKRDYSQGVATREFWLQHFTDRLANWGNDPNKPPEYNVEFGNYESQRPNVDIRHADNLSREGSWRKEYYAGLKKGVFNLPGWGGVKHFQSHTGYYPADFASKFADRITTNNGDIRKYLQENFRLRSGIEASPIRVPRFKRRHLRGLLADLKLNKGAEIGVKLGENAEMLYLANPNLHLLCIDPWFEYREADNSKVGASKAEFHYKQAAERLAKYKAEIIRKTSIQAAAEIQDESLDFIYIDGNHTFDFVMMDLILWSQKVRVGGIIAGHDYFRFHNAGVVPAVDTYTNIHGVHEWFITDEKESSYFWVKK